MTPGAIFRLGGSREGQEDMWDWETLRPRPELMGQEVCV